MLHLRTRLQIIREKKGETFFIRRRRQNIIGNIYLKGTIHTTAQGAEALAGVLPALGICEYSIEDPADIDFIVSSRDKLVWDYVDIPETAGAADSEVRVVFWLDAKERKKTDDVVRSVRTLLLNLKSDEQYGLYGGEADFGRLRLETELVADDWKDKYKETFRTFSPCEGIVVAPPWEAENSEAAAEWRESYSDALYIVIDPGMAFGTGSHETTSMCLRRLGETLAQGGIVLDAGAGSGILAIAAALLGARHVYAVEIDEDAAASAARNIEANGAEDRISLIKGDLTQEGLLPDGLSFDIITANLSLMALKLLLPVFACMLAENGALILSGLLDTQEGEIVKALKNRGFAGLQIEKKGEWLMVEARR